MSAPEARTAITVDDSRFQQAGKRIQEQFKQIENTVFTSQGKVQQSLTKSKSALGSFHSQIPPTKNALGNLATQANQTGDSLQNMGNKAGQAGKDTTALAVSVLGLGQSIGGVSDTVFGFNEKIVALEKSKFGLKETTEDVKRAEEDYTKALNEGFDSVQDQQRAEKDLLLIREKLAIETKEVKAEQEALNSEFVNFGLNVAQTGAFGLITIRQLFPQLTRAQVLATFSTANFTKALALGIPITAASTRAKIAATFAQKGLTAGIKATMVALGPVGWAIIGITTAFTLWETNAFGVRDALQELWKWLKTILPVLQLLEDAVKSVFPEAEESVTEFGNAVETSGGQVQTFTNIVGKGGSGGAIGAMKGFATTFGSTSEAIYEFNQQLTGIGVQDLENRITALTFSLEEFREKGIDPMAPEFRLARMAIVPEIESIADSMNDAFGEKRVNSFLVKMRRFGVLTREEFNGIKESLHLINKEMDEFNKKKAKGDLKSKDPKEVVEELDELGKAIVANSSLSAISQLFKEAAIQAKNGNLTGAIFLERAAQKLGNEAGNITGDPSLKKVVQNMKLTRDKFGHIYSNINFGSKDKESLAIAGIIQNNLTNSNFSPLGGAFNIGNLVGAGSPSQFSVSEMANKDIQKMFATITKMVDTNSTPSIGNQVGPTFAGAQRATGAGKRRAGGHNKFRSDTVGGAIQQMMQKILEENKDILNLTRMGIGLDPVSLYNFSQETGIPLNVLTGPAIVGGEGVTNYKRKQWELLQKAQKQLNVQIGAIRAKYYTAQFVSSWNDNLSLADAAKMEFKELFALRKKEEDFIKKYEAAGFDKNEILKFMKTENGRVDLANMEHFKRREAAASGVVV